MNVKSRTKGKHKRSLEMDPVRSSLDWKLDFLRQCSEFLQRWEDSKQPGLTTQTFLALRHTCLALADCAAYLLDHRGMNYILLGHLQSDAIERRFGWLRQLSGANYYISVRQVIESDRKIRALSLLKFSGLSLSDIDAAIQCDVSQSSDDDIADTIVEALQFHIFPSANDANVIFYVAGYLARSVVRTTKCQNCKECLSTSDSLEPIDIDNELDYSAATFLDAVNRGGLAKPTEYTFLLAVHCWRVFEEIKRLSELLKKIHDFLLQRTLFCKVMDRATCVQTYGYLPIDSNVCVSGHDLNKFVVERFFNCAAKNLVREMTVTAAGSATSTAKKKRKIAKLQSSAAGQ